MREEVGYRDPCLIMFIRKYSHWVSNKKVAYAKIWNYQTETKNEEIKVLNKCSEFIKGGFRSRKIVRFKKKR